MTLGGGWEEIRPIWASRVMECAEHASVDVNLARGIDLQAPEGSEIVDTFWGGGARSMFVHSSCHPRYGVA